MLAVAFLFLLPKLIIAHRTFGTNDVAHWLDFARGIRASGPVSIYSFHFTYSFYNHPPLIGYYLRALNAANTHLGISLPFGLRAVSSIADVASALLVFEIVRRRASLRNAILAGAGTAASPILFLVSGFHGNTDPVFVLFVLLAAFLLADKDRPVLAGCAMAIAISIKIVPVVAIPCLLAYAYRRGRRSLVNFSAGLAGMAFLIWAPALFTQWPEIKSNVLGYTGGKTHDWGIAEIGRLTNQPGWATYVEGNGRNLVVAFCALVPAILVWRNPRVLVQGVALSLLSFLTLTPTFGVQYMAWAAAPAFVLGVSAGYAFNLLGGLFLYIIYDRWSRGLPWYRAYASPQVFQDERTLGLVVWAVLLAILAVSIRQLARIPSPSGPPPIPTEDSLAHSTATRHRGAEETPPKAATAEDLARLPGHRDQPGSSSGSEVL